MLIHIERNTMWTRWITLILVVVVVVVSYVDGQGNVRFPGGRPPPVTIGTTSSPSPSSSSSPLSSFSCSPHDSCSSYYSSHNSRDALKLDSRPCNCDDACAEYGDCCPDARRYSEASAERGLRDWGCTMLRHYDGVYLKRRCPPGYADDDVREACEAEDGADAGEAEPWRRLPLTSLASQLTYRNSFCAACNNDTWGSPIVWTPHLECGDGSITRTDADEDTVWRTLAFNASANSWGFVYPRTNAFVSCSVDPQMPPTVEDLVRRCVPFVASCDDASWTDDAVRKRCASYTTYVYEGDKAFRNRDCAACNHADKLSCTRLQLRVSGRPKFNDHVFTILFDVNERTGDQVGKIKMCDDREVYDPFARKCRSVLCASADQKYRGGKCVADTSVKKTTTTTTTTTTVEPEVIIVPLEDDDIVSPPLSPSSLPPPTTTQPLSPTDPDTTTTTTPPLQPNATTEDEGDDGEDATTTTTEEPSSSTSNTTLPEVLFSNPSPDVLFNSTSSTEPTNLDCQQFAFNSTDYSVLENGSVYFRLYDRVLPPRDFRLDPDSGEVRVCIPSVLGPDHGSSNYERKFSVYLVIVSFSGLGISLFCLCLHLIAFALVPDLRNLSGKNLACLCASLLVADATFLVSPFVSIPPSLCAVVGVVMFFTLLASFFWMNVMAFDVWRALRQATTELRVASGRQWRKFAAYSCYAWLVPFALACVAVALDNAPVDSVPPLWRPAFGVQLCWFSQKRALLVFFVTPTVAIIGANGVLFSLSARMIVTSTRNSARLYAATRHRRNLRLYIRLALLMGLTWVSGIVAALADLEPLWYVFVVLNSLQGLFVFLCFTCTPKVLEALLALGHRWRRRCLGHRHRGGRGGRGGTSSSFVASSSSMSSGACVGGGVGGVMATKKKSGLDQRDSADSHSSHTSRTSLTQTTTSGSMDALY